MSLAVAIRNSSICYFNISEETKERIATTSLRTGLAMTNLFALCFHPTRQRSDACHCEERSDVAIRNSRSIPRPRRAGRLPLGLRSRGAVVNEAPVAGPLNQPPSASASSPFRGACAAPDRAAARPPAEPVGERADTERRRDGLPRRRKRLLAMTKLYAPSF